MKTVKKILGLLPPFFIWVMACVLVWGYVFTCVTDAPAEKKLALYIDAEVPGDTALATALEDAFSGRIRMAQVRSFTYAMFNGDGLKAADLFIVKASDMETYRDWFAPLPEVFWQKENIYASEGAPLGIRVYDGKEKAGIADDAIRYAEAAGEAEDYYLTFGALSCHNADNENAVDGLAAEAADFLLTMGK